MKRFSLAFVLTLTSCSDPVRGPAIIDFNVLTPHVWSGGAIAVRSSGIVPGSTPVMISGSDTLALLRVAADSIAYFRAPVASRTIVVHLADAPWLATAVRVTGFRDAYRGPTMGGYLVSATGNSPIPVVLANGESSLVRVDLRFNTVTAFPTQMHEPNHMRGAGPTADPDVFLLASQGRFALWRLSTRTIVQDTVPGADRIATQLGPNGWLLGFHHQICLRRGTPLVSDCRQYEEMNGVRFSPRGDRAFVHYGYSTRNGVPVFSTATGDTAFTITEAVAGGGGAFSAAGDTLWLAAVGSPQAASSLFALDATTGKRLAVIPLGAFPEDLAIDQTNGLLYIMVWGDAPVVVVVDRVSSEVIARVEIPVDSPSEAGICIPCDVRLFVDAPGRMLYVVGIGDRIGRASSQARIARIDLP